MIFELHPPVAAGPLRIGGGGDETVEILKQFGSPLVLCRMNGRRPGWGIDRTSGLFIGTFFDADDHVEASEFGRPDDAGDTVTYDGLDMFTMPAADLVSQLRQRCIVHEQEEEDGRSFIAPDLMLSLWQWPDGQEGEFFDTVLIARPSYSG